MLTNTPLNHGPVWNGSEIPVFPCPVIIFLLLYINSVKNNENNIFFIKILVFYKKYLYICNVLKKTNWSLTYLRLKNNGGLAEWSIAAVLY